MIIVNLTPHELNICLRDGTQVRTVAPSGMVARLETEIIQVKVVDGIPFFATNYLSSTNLPDRADDTIYVVSRLYFGSVYGRDDVFVPGESVRNGSGQVIGCVGLSV